MKRAVMQLLEWPALGLAALACIAAACSPSPAERVEVMSGPLEVVAVRSLTDPGPNYEIEVRRGDDSWSVRTYVAELADPAAADPDSVRSRLRALTAWREPYLFVRELNESAEASRSAVDHVFKMDGGTVKRLGTLSARFGPPGSQWKDGLFRDVYDRLEYTPLTERALAPGFELAMDERDGRFVVDSARTWALGLPEFERRLGELTALAEQPDRVATEAGRRAARGHAMHVLALARYCDREEDFRRCLALARRVLGEVEEVLEEVETVIPGELAASRDEVLRAHPALLNFFKESSDGSRPTAP